jgi:hypothetical protein
MDNFGFPVKKDNLRFILIGLAINIIGYLVMIGGGSDDPARIDAEALFSPIRITLAPILILAGFAIIIYGIMKKPSGKSED